MLLRKLRALITRDDREFYCAGCNLILPLPPEEFDPNDLICAVCLRKELDEYEKQQVGK